MNLLLQLSIGLAFAGPLHLPANSKTEILLQQMDMDEKIELVGGTGFATHENTRLKIPALQMSDGPVGIRFGDGTAWPAGIALSASFDPELARQVGGALGQEALAFDKNLLLGPMINIARVPWGGRVFESFGEDPYLVSQLASSYIQGLQSQGVGACVKHFAANNQEWFRSGYNANISERALQEIYFPGFKSAVDAGAISVMAAYNQVNGAFAAENSTLLQQVLKNDWSFQGFVVSDWGATHSTVPSALAGLDLEMPVAHYFSADLKTAITNGDVPEDVLNDKVRRILFAMERLGILDSVKGTGQKSHPDLALKVAQESIVLLQNKNQVLPLPLNHPLKVALLGPSLSQLRTGGGGSSFVTSTNAITALQGLKSRIAQLRAPLQLLVEDSQFLSGDPMPHPPLFYADQGQLGFKADYYNNESLMGSPVFSRIDSEINFDWAWGNPDPVIDSGQYSMRWTAKLIARNSGAHEFILGHNEGIRLYIDDKLILDHWQLTQNVAITEDRFVLDLKANEEHDVRLEYFHDNGLAYLQLGIVEPGELPDRAKVLAQNSDYAIVFVGNSAKEESESFDRTSLRLTPEQEALIQEVAAINPHTIIVLQAGSAIDMSPWLDSVAGVLDAWFPGDQGALAMADALLGQINPSGHLPLSFPKQWEDSSAAASYPGDNGQVLYSDDILVGYRHFDTNHIQPLFRFGFGLSYSRFTQKIISATANSSVTNPSADIDVEVRNQGPYPGDQLIPIYVSPKNPRVPKAIRELKAFARVHLNVGQKTKVSLHLDSKAFQYFSPLSNSWVVDPGKYQLELFSEKAVPVDSREIRLQ